MSRTKRDPWSKDYPAQPQQPAVQYTKHEFTRAQEDHMMSIDDEQVRHAWYLKYIKQNGG